VARIEFPTETGLCCKPEVRVFDSDQVFEFLSIYLILSAALGPLVYSASNRNKHQKQKKMFLGYRTRSVHKGVHLTTQLENHSDDLHEICEEVTRETHQNCCVMSKGEVVPGLN
jgi:hypothetical protein